VPLPRNNQSKRLRSGMAGELSSNGDSPPEDQLQLSISFSTDRDGFWRRTCPSCGRDFKTDYEEANLASVLAPQFRRMEREIGVSPPGEGEGPTPPEGHFACPYFGDESPHGEMLTEEAVRYLHRLLMREIVIPRFNQAISRGLGGSGRSRDSGRLVSMTLEHHRSLRPCRPIHGPEPPDMKVVDFLCCGRKAKIEKRWYSLKKCIYCQTSITLI